MNTNTVTLDIMTTNADDTTTWNNAVDAMGTDITSTDLDWSDWYSRWSGDTDVAYRVTITDPEGNTLSTDTHWLA